MRWPLGRLQGPPPAAEPWRPCSAGMRIGPAWRSRGSGFKRRATLGIDLGTTTSAVAVIGADGRPHVVTDEDGGGMVPSVVIVQPDGSVLAGKAAAAALEGATADPANTYYSFKRLMGRSYSQLGALTTADGAVVGAEGSAAAAPQVAAPGLDGAIVGGGGPRRQLSYSLVEGPRGGFAFACPALGRTLQPPEVSAHLLRHLLQRAESYLHGRAADAAAATAAPGGAAAHAAAAAAAGPHDAVVTVPADFGPLQKAAVMEAAKAAGLRRVTLLQEPIAAALAYGFGAASTPWDVLLVVDLGGGTLDVTIVEAFDGIMEVLATAGDDQLGGDDFTAAVADWLAAQQQQQQQGQGGNGRAAGVLALWRAAEAAKVRLSESVERQRRNGGQQEPPHGSDRARSSSNTPSSSSRGGGAGNSGAGSTELSETEFARITLPLMRRLWLPLEEVATATRAQFSGSLPPHLDPAADRDSRAKPNSRAGVDHSSSTSNSSNGRSSRSSSGSGIGAAASAGLPGRRDGADAWQFSIFAHQAQQRGGSGKYVAPPRRLTGVVLVGAATRLPAIRDYITTVTGLPLRPGVDPETAVALGAAIHAGIMDGSLAGGVELGDGGYVAGQHGRASGFQTVGSDAIGNGSSSSSGDDGAASLVWEP